eukprot:Opistho-2@35186
MQFVQSKLLGIGEFLTPVLKASKFQETGVLTPEEFVAAGDFLVFKCSTWAWESGEDSKRRSYLPPDKQYLVTRNVPCFKRAKNMEYVDEERTFEDEDDEGGWIETHTAAGASDGAHGDELVEITAALGKAAVSSGPTTAAPPPKKNASTPATTDCDSSDDDVPDMDDYEEENLEEEDAGALPAKTEASEGVDNILKSRTYDLHITYDKYYQTPRLWLSGYDEQRKPLSVEATYEDLSQDHAKKTVTIESHPHLSLSLPSIHPCRHSNVMKKIIQNVGLSGGELGVHM